MKKFLIDDEEHDEKDFYANLEQDIYDEVDENYDEILDEYGDIDILGISYSLSEVLKRVDEIRYRCGVSDEVDARLSDANYDLERGEEVKVNGYYYKIEEVEDDWED